MYNFTIASQLKAWIDRILVVGKTFQYGEKGLEGLAVNKRVIIAVARGLLYGSGTPNAPGEHLVAYLRWIFGYMGIANPEFIVAEGTRLGPENRKNRSKAPCRTRLRFAPSSSDVGVPSEAGR